MEEKSKTIILGGGPAGLGAGMVLAKEGIKCSVFEKDSQVGGISKTIEKDGFYFDLGGHRFFTKSKEVQDLWNEALGEENFLKRPRLSRIYYKNKFFYYPLKPLNAFINMGPWSVIKVLSSYAKAKVRPYKTEETFDKWVTNRFGKELYKMFFKSYTEKVWGIPCEDLDSEWVAQRIKGLSLREAIKNAFFNNNKITTLITEFSYPKYGPGMMYSAMKDKVNKNGGEVILNTEVKKINLEGDNIKSVILSDGKEVSAENYISSIPLNSLIKLMGDSAPKEVQEAAKKLKFRSFLTVNVVLNEEKLFPDNWIYVHSPEVKLGRIQNFKNWSKYMCCNPEYTNLGLEYFCDEGDDLWNMKDEDLIKFAVKEMEKIKISKASSFVSGFVVRVPNAYPLYAFDYQKNIEIIKSFLSKIKNLQTIGRAGMFRYNNMDHSVLSGIYAAKNILGGNNNIWDVNAEEEYHEEDKNK
jgi:protoporphyrinogen oxidase